MKKTICLLLLTVYFIVCGFTSAFAQQQPQIPIDLNVRIGKLDNGLTYYIRKNGLPANRADFYIAQKVGSIQETAEQKGLAHFLEHICFNGTTHFPGNGVIQYLESIGVQFGGDLNAYTGVEETVYNINNVPIAREGVIDSCLLILHDWSNDLLLDSVEIDKERGVIYEEWRSQTNAFMRLLDKALPKIFAGTQYEHCLPVGSMDVVLNFPHQVLRDYYETWYRPDLQGIVVVGDVDVDLLEYKIKTLFGKIPAKPNAPERVYYPVNDNVAPIVAIHKEKEQSNFQFMLYNKYDVTPDAQKGNMEYLVIKYLKNIIVSMLNSRLEELSQVADPPYFYASSDDGNFIVAKTKGAYSAVVICKEDAVADGFKALLRELERARRFGFTETEYSRARTEFISNLESEFHEKDKKKNEYYTTQYVRHFLDNEPIPGIENEYSILSQMAPAIPVDAVNELFPTLYTSSNQAVLVLAPDKAGIAIPTEEEITSMIQQVQGEELTAYVDQVSDEPLMAELPAPGEVVSEKKDARFNTTEFTLSNGATVIIKHTDFKADEILMNASSWGGTSLYPISERVNLSVIDALISAGGLGNFSPVELEKALAGKRAGVDATVSHYTEMVAGSCSPRDLETMLQLTYLTFTSPRRDEDAFASFKSRMKAGLQNEEQQPTAAFGNTLRKAIYMDHPIAQRVRADMIDLIDYDKVLNIYKDRFKDASDFTFVFVGNIHPEEAKPLIEQYIGGLPSLNSKETFVDLKMEKRKGIYKNVFVKEQEVEKASNIVVYSGECPYTLSNVTKMNMVKQLLDYVYTEKIRENEGGSYNVYVTGNMMSYPKENFSMQVVFESDPGNREKLMKIVVDEVQELATNGPSEINLNKAKEYMLKKFTDDLKENDSWMSFINAYILSGVDFYTEQEAVIKSITAKEIRDFANELFVKQRNEIEVSMISSEKK